MSLSKVVEVKPVSFTQKVKRKKGRREIFNNSVVKSSLFNSILADWYKSKVQERNRVLKMEK